MLKFCPHYDIINITRQIEREETKMLIGRYECNIDKGAISIPWLDKDQMKANCFYTVMEYNGRAYIYVHEKDIIIDAKIVESGQCIINENNQWLLPNSVLMYISKGQCVWIGMGDRAELLTKNQLDEDEPSSDELKSLKNTLSALYDL